MKLAISSLLFNADSIPSTGEENAMNSLGLDKLPVNFFDVAVVAILVGGLIHGRKRGMSGELLNLLKWLAVVLVCSFTYEPIGQFLVRSSDLFSPLSAYLSAYVVVAGLIVLLFAGINRALGGKLLGSDIFGHTEYYLGMGSGVVRGACILLAGLALVNARLYSQTDIKAAAKYQDDAYGSNFFPTLQTFQASVFNRSFSGPYIKEYLAFALIKPTPSSENQFKQREAWMP